MEIAVIAGLAFLGSEINKTYNKEQTNTKPIIQQKKIQHQNVPHMQPFYKREGGMNLSNKNDIKTRTLETFTGSTDYSYAPKKEQQPLFKPHENIQNIYGNKTMSDDVFKRYQTGLTMNNVSPIEKQQVGPGLNTPEDVAARGGFHQFFRIMPDNVGAYKKNSFGGRVISGKGITEAPTKAPNQVVHKPETYFEQSQHPTMQSKSAFNAPVAHSVISPDCTNRGNSNSHIGVAKGPDASQSHINGTRVGNVPLNSLPTGAASRQDFGSGGYTVSKYLTHETDRENCGVVTNANDQSSGSYILGQQQANPTSREGTTKGYSGSAGFYSTAQSNYSTAYNADSYHKREDVQKSYTPNGGNMNLRQDAQELVGSTKIRNDCNNQSPTIASIPNSLTVKGDIGHIEYTPKLPECNPHQDLSIASSILQNNPYAVH